MIPRAPSRNRMALLSLYLSLQRPQHALLDILSNSGRRMRRHAILVDAGAEEDRVPAVSVGAGDI